MTKKAIALKGISNVGKSETIKKVYELFKIRHPHLTIIFEKIYKVDITIILEIKGVKIGIESQGDPNGNLVKGSLTRFVKKGCRVIICSTRTSGQTVDAVTTLQHQGYELLELLQVKAKQKQQAESNIAMAIRIIKEAEKIINA